MYTRSYNRNRDSRYQRYTPPPGYVGTAFLDDTEVKHHTPEQELPLYRTEDSDIAETESDCEELSEVHGKKEKTQKDESPLISLIESLRGKISAEELIILMTMFLISSDGICAEALILALVLTAGREK